MRPKHCLFRVILRRISANIFGAKWVIHHVQEKKETETSFVISCKTRAIMMKFGNRFLNKFAEKWCKRFPPHLNNVSTFPCKTWTAHCARATPVELLQKETPEFTPPHLWPPNSPDLNSVDTSTWEMLQEKVYKTCITALKLSTTLLTNGFRSGDIAQL